MPVSQQREVFTFKGKCSRSGIHNRLEKDLQLISCFSRTISVVTVNNEDEALGILEVVPPKWANLVLATNVPNGKVDILVFDSLDVEPDGWDGGNDLTQLELVKNGGLTGGIETNHENSHLLLGEKALEHTLEPSHGCELTGSDRSV